MISIAPSHKSASPGKRNLYQRFRVDGVKSQSPKQTLQLLHQEIEKRKTQQWRIFAFSNAIAGETDPILLAQVLKVHLKAIFDITEYAVLGLNAEKTTYRPLLYDSDASTAKLADVHHFFQQEMAVNPIINNLLTRECPSLSP